MARKKAETKITEEKVTKTSKTKVEKPTTKKKSTKSKKEKEVVEIPVEESEPEIISLEENNINDFLEYEDTMETFYDPEEVQMTLDGLASISKDVKQSMAYVNDTQVRLILDNYYATQQHRMNIKNQIRAVEQGFDKVQEGDTPAIAWLVKDVENRENQIKKMIAEYVKTVPVCRWAMAIKGIGPVFAANLWSYIDMSKCRHANQFLSYAGLNDNNVPWLGKEKAKEIVDEAYEYFGLKSSDPVTDDVLLRVAIASGRTGLHTVKKNFLKRKGNNTKTETDKLILINYMAMPPYNIDLKKMCYLIGESFCKVSNRGSLYGQIYKERKALETMKNDRGDYKEQAEQLLREKNYSKGTDTYKFLSQGKLSPGHINERAKRYAVKIFLTHFFECCWIYTHHTKPPVLYVIEHLGHVDYIEPEVPYGAYVK